MYARIAFATSGKRVNTLLMAGWVQSPPHFYRLVHRRITKQETNQSAVSCLWILIGWMAPMT